MTHLLPFWYNSLQGLSATLSTANLPLLEVEKIQLEIKQEQVSFSFIIVRLASGRHEQCSYQSLIVSDADDEQFYG